MIKIESAQIDYEGRRTFDLVCGRFNLKLSERTHIMGIINVTPDSFSDGGLYFDEDNAVERAKSMAGEGADIIDIGGESTRPGAKAVPLKEEIKRVIPVIKKIAKKINIPISVDTSKSEVAERALYEGANIVNDITGLKHDPKLAKVVAKRKAALVLMHMKGTPRTMQRNPRYKALISEIIYSLKKSIEVALEAGIERDKIMIDPGIGFGKTTEHNLEILKNLSKFRNLGFPILIGPSRKSLIGNVLNLPIEERLMGTAATIAISIWNGADVIRVHDVKEMVQVARMTDAIFKSRSF